MKFGYFTLSDNRYPDNPRSPEQFVQDIFTEAQFAETVGLNSAWIGEHHFNMFGVNASPLTMLATLAGATSRIRLAPAVTLTPLHHPLQVAEDWGELDLLSGGRVDFAAGRGYDKHEYEPFEVDFHASADIFAEGLEIIWRAWTEPGKWSHKGKYYNFNDIEVRPRPHQSPMIPYVACFSNISLKIAAENGWHIIFAPFAAKMVFGSLADAVAKHGDGLAANGHPQRASKCSYFIHIADNADEENYGRERLIRYFHDSVMASFPQDIKTAPPTLAYFIEMVERLKKMEPETLTSDSILVGSAQTIIDTLKKIEAAGIGEVVLYFNYGLKPHAMVKDQMQKFMEEIAPHFDGALPETAE